jgi:hypothetical protein
MWHQQSDPIFNMGVDVMKPAIHFEPNYTVTMLIREEWTRGLIWFRDGSRMKEGTRAGVYGQSVGRGLNTSLGRYATVFRLKYTLSSLVLMKFDCMVDQRST